jgi:hypothetical protein
MEQRAIRDAKIAVEVAHLSFSTSFLSQLASEEELSKTHRLI